MMLIEVIKGVFIANFKAAEHPILNVIVGGLWGGATAKAASCIVTGKQIGRAHV